jgi:pyruvate carboxylase subunit B
VVVEPLNSYVASQGGNRPAISAEGDVGTTMPGNIVDVLVAEGDAVEAGQAVLIIEAMKMETELQAPIGGTVTAVNAAKGDRVTPGEALIQIQS